MKISFPALSKKRLRWLLDQTYGDLKFETLDAQGNAIDPADAKLLFVVRSMQRCNLDHRQNECFDLYPLFNSPYFLEPNSEGTTLWLATALAIKDLCALSDGDLKNLIYSVY